MNRKKKWRAVGCLAAVAVTAWLVWGNVSLETEYYTVTDKKIPEAFSGYRIAHVSDLHNAAIGKGNCRLLAVIRDAEPDIIVITGDLIDSRRTDMDVAFDFVREAAQIAPVLYVSGNHEARLDYSAIRQGLWEAGANILDDAKMILGDGETGLTFVGLADRSFSSAEEMSEKLDSLLKETAGYRILLCHRPELFDIFQKKDIDLMLSGHAHGGQVRIPFIGGLYTPDQGLFPKYDAGLYEAGGSRLLISRGLGDTILPLRIWNRHTLLVIELRSSNQDVYSVNIPGTAVLP